MSRFLIRLTFLTFRLDFEVQAHVFWTWSVGHKILQIKNRTTYKNNGDVELIVLELLQKYKKSAVLTRTNDPLQTPISCMAI